MSVSRQLVEKWMQGMNYQEIADYTAERWTTPVNRTDVERRIKEECAKIRASAIQAALRSAAEGHIAAIEWLEQKGVLEIPKPPKFVIATDEDDGL